MMRKYAVFGRLNDFLGDISASNEDEALVKAKMEWPHAERVILVVPGGDFGVNGIH